MRKKIVAGNWKMNLTLQEGLSLISEIIPMAQDELRGDQHLVICAPAIHLSSLTQLAKHQSKVDIGAQNCHHEKNGAYTGEVSAAQVASTGAKYVIIGHSERRMFFQEDAFQLNKKMQLALENGLNPIYCVGETKDEREYGDYFKVISQQLEEVLKSLSVEQFKNVVIAYEPVWAIGTGLTASPEQAQEVHAFIREKIAQLFNVTSADDVSILYGGSCNPGNAPQLFAQPDIDGGLIGGASLKSRDFMDIAKVFN